MLLALAAYRASPRVDARGAVISAMLATRDPRALAIMRGDGERIFDAAISSDGRTLASAGADHKVRLWDVRTHKQLGAPLTGHSEGVIRVAFSPDGRTLASCSADGTIRLWDVRERSLLSEPLPGHTGVVRDVAFSPDGRTLASGGDDRTIRLWNVRTREQVGAPLTGSTQLVASLAFSPDGRALASVDDALRLWDVRPPAARRAVVVAAGGDPRRGVQPRWPHARRREALRRRRPAVDARTRRRVGEPLGADGSGSQVLDLAFAPDERLASAGDGGTVRLWDAATRRQLTSLRGHDASAVGVAFGPDGRTLASASRDTTIRLWDISPPQPFAADADDTSMVDIVKFSPDGRRLAAASDDTTIRVWDAGPSGGWALRCPATRASRTRWRSAPTDARSRPDPTKDGFTCGTCGPAGGSIRPSWEATNRCAASRSPPTDARSRRAATTAPSRLWDLRTHRQVGAPLAGGEHLMRTVVAFSPDGRLLATSSGGAIHVWDVVTRQRIGSPLAGHTGVVEDVAFSPDGGTLGCCEQRQDHPAVGHPRPRALRRADRRRRCRPAARHVQPRQGRRWRRWGRSVVTRSSCGTSAAMTCSAGCPTTPRPA